MDGEGCWRPLGLATPFLFAYFSLQSQTIAEANIRAREKVEGLVLKKKRITGE
jgi:hypothetical protein